MSRDFSGERFLFKLQLTWFLIKLSNRYFFCASKLKFEQEVTEVLNSPISQNSSVKEKWGWSQSMIRTQTIHGKSNRLYTSFYYRQYLCYTQKLITVLLFKLFRRHTSSVCKDEKNLLCLLYRHTDINLNNWTIWFYMPIILTTTTTTKLTFRSAKAHKIATGKSNFNIVEVQV